MCITISRFRLLCLLSTQSLSSVENSEPTYSSVKSLNTNEDDDALDVFFDDADAITDDDDDNLICQMNFNADNYRPCETKADNDAVLGKNDSSLVKKTLLATEAAHLNTKSLFAKADDIAKTVDLDVSRMLAEQVKDPVLGTVRSWLRERILPDLKVPRIQPLKGLLRYCQEFDRLMIEGGQLLCSNEPSDKLEDENLRICSPLSLTIIFSLFQTLPPQRNVWTHGRFKNLQNCKTIPQLAWLV